MLGHVLGHILEVEVLHDEEHDGETHTTPAKYRYCRYCRYVDIVDINLSASERTPCLRGGRCNINSLIVSPELFFEVTQEAGPIPAKE